MYKERVKNFMILKSDWDLGYFIYHKLGGLTKSRKVKVVVKVRPRI